MTARALALAALAEWRRGQRFADSIIQHLLAGSQLSGADRGFATELFYGVLRNLTLLDSWIGLLRPASVDATARDLLRLGLYQLFFLHTPEHAAVFETVALTGPRRRPLVNAVLRAAQRREVELTASTKAAPLSVRKSHPEFLLERWTRAFGDSATAALCEWNNEAPPTYARINLLRGSVQQFVRELPSSELLSEAGNFVRLETIPIEALERGECYIQDPSTRVACELLDPQPGDDVLDACAAPGGKTGFIAELMKNRGRLIACDRDAARIKTLKENLARLGATVARTFRQDWLSGRAIENEEPLLFDRILLDAPCTNTGVMRRRVDVRWRLTAKDFARMQGEQLQMLRSVMPLLKGGGALVYSTCSLEAEENEQVVTQALKEFPFLEVADQKSVLPFRDGFDGAFAARLTKTL